MENPTTKIVLVEGWQLGVNVVDTATGGQDPIVGAHVRVVSRYNGKEVSGDTLDDGIVKFDIRELAEDVEGVGVENLSVYAFNGTITVDCLSQPGRFDKFGNQGLCALCLGLGGHSSPDG